MKCVMFLAVVLCVMVASVRSQAGVNAKTINDQRARLALLAKTKLAQQQSGRGGMNSIFPMAMMMGGNDNILPMIMFSQMMRGGGGGGGMGGGSALPLLMMNEMGIF